MPHSTSVLSTTRYLTSQERPSQSSSPIPIPISRKMAYPPPPSPCRELVSSDMIFDMSPHASETFLAHERSYLHDSANSHIPELLPPFASRLGHKPKPSIAKPAPYAHEPFLYSIPRLPARPLQRVTSLEGDAVTISRYERGPLFTNTEPISKQTMFLPSPDSLDTPSSGKADLILRENSFGYNDSKYPLTSAFQQSFYSSTSRSQSFCTPTSLERFDDQLKPSSPSTRRRISVIHSPRMSPRHSVRGVTKNAALRVLQTSAAEPVVSFAQAELVQSNGSGKVTKVKVKRSSGSQSRPRSPYTIIRGRRNSILRDRGPRLSDEDIASTLDKERLSEKFGLEKFLPATPSRRVVVYENFAVEGELEERGRTRSRARSSRRA